MSTGTSYHFWRDLNMPAVVSSVVQGSIADELEIEEGDILLSIDGEKLLDMIDYRFLCKNEFITIEIQKRPSFVIPALLSRISIFPCSAIILSTAA